MNNENIRTLDDLIMYGKTSDYNIPSSVFLIKEENFIFIQRMIYEDYRSIVLNAAQTITLTDTQWKKYMYKPELLSSDLYDTPNLAHLIMYLNGGSIYKFNNRKLTLLSPKEITDTLLPIMIRENDRMTRNRVGISIETGVIINVLNRTS